MSSPVDDIISSLKSLGFPSDSWQREWMEELLTQQNSSRNELLKWTLSQLGLPNLESFNECLNGLITLGVFQYSDAADIEGTSGRKSQLKFWKRLIKCIENYKNNSTCLTNYPDESARFLEKWTSMPHSFQSTKDQGLTILPADLLKLYKQKKLSSLEMQSYPNIEASPSEEEEEEEEIDIEEVDLSARFLSLTETSKNLNKVHDLNLAPWCLNQVSSPDSSLMDAIRNNHHQTSIFTSILESVENVDILARDLEVRNDRKFEESLKASAILRETLKE